MQGPGTGADPASSGTPYTSRLEHDWLTTEPEVRHRRISGSLMSADLSGFTALSERLAGRGKEGSERLTSMVNGCFTSLINAADHEGGDVLKFGGDALLLWFDGPGHGVRAARAGARMQHAIGAARFSRAGLRMSVGAHAGEFDAFLVGRPDWRELVLAGRPVSTSVEMEAAASAGEVLLSPGLAHLVPVSWRGEGRGGGVLLTLDAVPLPRRRGLQAHQVRTGELPERTRADVDALAGLGGEHRMATVVFAELEGTDTRIEADPTAMAASIESLVRATQEQSDRYGLRFLYSDVISDGIKLICTAGAPTSTGQDEEAGLRFATDLVAGDPQGRLRIGVNRGRVFAGFLGSENRRTYTVMGDPVNLAARLMAHAEPGQVVASDDVVRRSQATFRLNPLPPFLVKGRVAPVTAHVVEAATGERQGQQQSALPLVGREEEVALLTEAIAAAATGSGEVIEITGDAGIGKTRLLDAVADDPRLVVRVRAECQPYDALSPYASARTLLRRALGIPGKAAAAQAGRQLLATAQRLAPDVVPMLPLAAVALGADVPATPEADAVAEQFRTERMHEAVCALLAAALPQTTLLVVEDVYYADDASLRLFRAIASGVESRPWLMLVTKRPEGPGLVAGEVAGTVLKLAPLPDADVARLAVLATGGEHFHPLEQEAVSQRAGGNPLFLLQLVSATRAGTSADELPESIERVVATRIDRLRPAERALLRQAAVVGRIFHFGVLDALRTTNGADPVTPEQWEALADLVEPEGDARGRFRHALFRDVAYEGLPFARRRRMHAAVGDLLEAGAAGEPDVALLSEHFWLAGDAERTWRYSVAAGQRAWNTFAVAEAIAAYQRALGVRRRLRQLRKNDVAHVSEALGDALERAGRYEDAEFSYAVAQRTTRGGPPPHLLRKRGVLRERKGELTSAMRWYERALVSARRTLAQPDAELARVELAKAGTMHRQGRQLALAEHTHAALGYARKAADTWLEAYALDLLLIAAIYGVEVEGERYGAEALRLFEQLGDVLHQGKVLNNLGVSAYYQGRWADAANRWVLAAQSFDRAGDVAERATAINNRAEILSDQGQPASALEQFTEAERLWRSAGHGVGVALAAANKGRALGRIGEAARAQELLMEAETRFREYGATSYVLECQARRAEVSLLSGASHEAESLALAVVDAAEQGSSEPTTRVLALRVAGTARVQLSDLATALGRLEQAASEAADAGLRFERAQSLTVLAMVLDQLGMEGSETLAHEASELLELLGVSETPRVPLPG